MQELVKYFEALEARLAAQDARIAAQDERVAALEARLAEAEQRLAEQAQAEPEVEVDLVYPEDEEVTVELPQEEPAAAPEPENMENIDVPEAPEIPETPETQEEPAPAPVPEPVVEPAPVVESAPEPVQPIQPAQPEAPRMPQQTSLFGTPVTDIRQAVSIGDRFLFQRELFAGNAEKLQQTLTELDKLNSLEEATAFIEQFGWDKLSSTYELFQNVLRRRFQ